MSLSYQQIVDRLEAIEQDLGERQREYEVAAEDVHRYARDYELRQARCLLAAEGENVTERKARALIAIAAAGDDLYANYREAEGRYEGLRAAVKVLETRATIGMALLKAYTRESGPQPQWSRSAA